MLNVDKVSPSFGDQFLLQVPKNQMEDILKIIDYFCLFLELLNSDIVFNDSLSVSFID